MRNCSARWWAPWPPLAIGYGEVEGLVVLDGPRVDPLKLTLVLSGTGADGIAVEDDLLAAGLPVEAAERDTTWRRCPAGRRGHAGPASPTGWCACWRGTVARRVRW